MPGLDVGDMHQGLNNSANSSTGISSLTTGSNSGISRGSNLQRSMSMNTNSTTSSGTASMGLPASPLSFSSSNVSVPCSSALGSVLTRSGCQQDIMIQQQQQLQQATPPSSNTSQQLHTARCATHFHQEQQRLDFGQQIAPSCELQNVGNNQQPAAQLTVGMYANQQVHGPGLQSLQGQRLAAMKQDLQVNELPFSQVQALAGVKLRREDLLRHHLVQNMCQRPESLLSSRLQRQESLQWQQSQQIQAQLNFLQQQRLLQQQQLLQSLPQHLKRSNLQQQQQQQQLQHRLQQQIIGLTRPVSEHGTCARRLMQYLQSQRMRPVDNSINFWREFVAEYFAPHAKMRWCVSLYGTGGRPSTGVFPQDLYHCDICHSNPGRGFEVTLEVLPRLFKIKYDNGELEELLFVDVPHEYKLNSGLTVLDYGKAMQESLFGHLRVVRDGHLRIIFSPDLKIVSWDFCAGGHEELLSCRTVLPQVNQLAQLASKCQIAFAHSGNTGISSQELQTNCNMFVASAHQLAKSLEAPINEIGFTKRFVRCLQISEVVNSMKDLIDFSHENKLGPMESLSKFPRRMANLVGSQQQTLQPQEQAGLQSFIAEQNSNKLHPVQLSMDKQITDTFNRSLGAHAQRLVSFQPLHHQNPSPIQTVVQNNATTGRNLSGSGSFNDTPHASSNNSLTSVPASFSSLPCIPQQPCLDNFNQQNTDNIVHQLLQEMMNPQSNNSGNLHSGQGTCNPGNAGLHTGLGNNMTSVFPGSDGLPMNTGNNIGIMENGMGCSLGMISGSLAGNSAENGISIANCVRNMGSNASAGNVGSINAIGSRMNLAAIAQQQKLHAQEGTPNSQCDFSHGLNSLGSSHGLNSLGSGVEFGSLPLNWKS